MDTYDLDRRLAFLDIRETDLDALRELAPIFEANADSFVAFFYRHLLSFEETRSLLLDPEVKQRLLGKQREYLLSLTAGTIDRKYLEDRMRIGEAHVRVGLQPRWYLGAYSLYLKLLVPIVMDHYRHDDASAQRALSALHKILMLDAQLAMETYIQRRQHQLEYLNQELGEASRELRRVYDQQSVELRQTSARAEAAEELASIATLVAGLAHEIGTPMGVIQGHAELLENSVVDERGRWRLKTIRDQIDRIANIIQTLLNLARPHAREHAPLDLEAVVQASLSFLKEKLRIRQIRAEIRSEGPARVLGDTEKLQQLFLNLFLNAADAMPQGGSLDIELRSVDDEIEVRVRDTGQGMPESVRARVFEPFFTTKEAGRGSGLGLMVVAGIVRDHGGTIEVKSELGRGSEFVIHFPRHRVATDGSET